MDDDHDLNGMIDYAWSHAVISDEDYHSFKDSCDSKSNNESSPLCDSAIRNFIQMYADIDIYSLYTPVCVHRLDKTTSRLAASAKSLSKHVFNTTYSLPYKYLVLSCPWLFSHCKVRSVKRVGPVA